MERLIDQSAKSLGVRLLADLRGVFGDAHALHTTTILERLHALDEAPWSNVRGEPLNSRRLSKLLSQYSRADGTPIRSRDVKLDGHTLKGYYRADLTDAWLRYASDTEAATSSGAAADLFDTEGGTLPS